MTLFDGALQNSKTMGKMERKVREDHQTPLILKDMTRAETSRQRAR